MGTACCIQVRPAIGVARCSLARAASASRQPVELALDHVESRAQLQHEAGVDRVLAGRAPVDEAGRLRVVLAHVRRELPDQRDREIAGRWPLRGRAPARRIGRRRRRTRSSTAAEAGMTPACASARASAASKSSIACRRARSEKLSSTSSQRNSGPSRLKGTSAVEEYRLSGPLQYDVPLERSAGAASRPPGVGRRAAGTRPRTWSVALAGSSGKYIRVTSRFIRPRAKTETAMCGACIPPRGPGTGPGLTVVKRKRPLASVATRP